VVKTDVLIIGGGPAGLAAAIAARMKGFAVTVVDAAKPPIDKACGEGLMPDGVETLKKLGVRLAAQQFAPFRGIRFIHGDTAARADFPGVYGLGVRRTTLHPVLVERAQEVGVTLLWNTTARELDTNQARWIVGADGMNSWVRRWAGFGECPARLRRFGFRRHFPVAPWNDTVDVHWGRDCQVYVTPVGASELCVAVISRHQQLRLDEALQDFPELTERLNGFLPTTPERGSVTECRRLSRVYRGNVALIGDASGSVDAVTGEGLALSFKHALALADAFAADDLRLYDAAHRRIVRIPALMSDLMLLMDQRAWLRHRVIRALASESGLFSKLLAIHIDAMSPLEAGLSWFPFSKTA
jgi:flavin-dependent dehydrogenase